MEGTRKLLGRVLAIWMVACMMFTASAFGNSVSAATVKPTKMTVSTTAKTVDIKGKATISVKSVTPKKASKAVTFKSSNKKVATVSTKGVVTGKKKGVVKITVTSKKNKKLKKTVKIVVKNLKPTSVKMSKSTLSLNKGKTYTLKAKVYPNGLYIAKAGKWASSNTSVAKVSSKGVVTAVAPGTAKITYTAAEKSSKGKLVKGTTTVTVPGPEKGEAVLVDARSADVYAGWAVEGNTKGGHLKGAVNISAQWLTCDYSSDKRENKTRDEAIEQALTAGGIEKGSDITVYDTNGKDAAAVKKYLEDHGYFYVTTKDATEEINAADDLVSYANYEMNVPAEVVKSISDNVVNGTELSDQAKAVVDGKPVKILHAEYASDGKYTAEGYKADNDIDWSGSSYAKTGHVPGATPISTDDFEPEVELDRDIIHMTDQNVSWIASYLLVDDNKAIELAEKYGINKDDCVIVTGYEPMSTCKIAVILKYLGVDNIHVMGGAFNSWNAAGYELEKTMNEPAKGVSFGVTSPANPDLIDTQDEAEAMLKDSNVQLVDTRTVEEFAGESSGYGYYDLAGTIEGTVNSPSGIGYSSGMYYYRNPDKTMRSQDAIEAMWKSQGVDTSKHLSFFCGSGWRAAEELWDGLVMGYDVSMYNDGWQGWAEFGHQFLDKNGKKMHLDQTTHKLVRDYNTYEYTYVLAEDLLDDIQAANSEYTIIDVRQDEDESGMDMGSYKDAHLVSAISAPLMSNDYAKLSDDEAVANLKSAGVEAGSDKKFVFVCYYGGEVAERAYTLAADEIGIPEDQLFILDGGQWSYDPEWSWMCDNPCEAPEYLVSVGASKAGVSYYGVTVDQLKADIAGKAMYNVVDVRAAADYEAGHIEGAVSAPVKTGDDATDKASIKAVVDEKGTNAVYCLICYSGNAYADAAQNLLIEQGVPAGRIVRLSGGQTEWDK